MTRRGAGGHRVCRDTYRDMGRLVSRYVHNVHVAVAVAGMAQSHIALPYVLLFVEWLLEAVYDIKMKWEPLNGVMVDWCECQIKYDGDFLLLLKGPTVSE